MQNRGSFRVYYAWTPTSRYLWTTFNRNSVSQRRTWSNVRIFYEPIVIPNRLYESYLLSIRASNIIFFAQKTSCQLYRNFGRENKIARWKRNTLHNVKFMEKEMKVRGKRYCIIRSIEWRAIINLRKQVLVLRGTIARCL